jgi:signal transduction histidine kinase
MIDLPAPVDLYIKQFVSRYLRPGYLALDHDLRLLHWVGETEHYGLRDLETGQNILEQVSSFEGILPPQSTPWFLSCIEFPSGSSANIHIFSDDSRYWVLFLSAEIEQEQRAVLQQKNRELALLQLEQTRLMQSLSEANRELKNFVYIVSHDLRSPLINLKGFSAELKRALKVVEEAYPDGKNENQQDNAVWAALYTDIPEALDYIESSVEKLDRFIAALLKLSRLGQREFHLELVDLTALVKNVVQLYSHQLEQKGIHVSVVPLPSLECDHTSMEQIWMNLIANAVQYLDPERPGIIKIFCDSTGKIPTFTIQDNGQGIQSEDLEKIFHPFHRSGRQDSPGEGMGLSYVQTLIRRYGGRIWCESEFGKGSSFFFTIPETKQ